MGIGKTLKKKLRKVFLGNKKNKNEIPHDFFYEIEGYNLLFPYNHKLPDYQCDFKNYDKKLKVIVEQIQKNIVVSNSIIVDIGANVGDTVASIRKYTQSLICCIEGDSFYLNYLRENVKLFDNVLLFESYVAGVDSVAGKISRGNGTARIVTDNETEDIYNKLKIKQLAVILNEAELKFENVELLKIDTDGFDFQILLANRYFIEKFKFNLYFEYDISFNKDDYANSLELMKMLDNSGYKLIVYDNFGNLLEIIQDNFSGLFELLNGYLISCRKNGGGIYYFDIFATTDFSLIEQIRVADTLV